MNNLIKIATRNSVLALWQANFIKEQILKIDNSYKIEIVEMTTKGDRILDKSLSKIGGKGLFIKELEYSLLEDKADIAVHSMKDVPMELENDFEIVAITSRANPFDAFVSNKYNQLEDLPNGSIIGTSSLRRESQLRYSFPNLIIKPLRGNVQTRISKLENGLYDGIILAVAGLERVKLDYKIKQILDDENSFLPSPGQGAVGIEILKKRTDIKELLLLLNDKETSICVHAERLVAKILGGSCQVPLAVYAKFIDNNRINLKVKIANKDGSDLLFLEGIDYFHNIDVLANKLSYDLLAKGAQKIIDNAIKYNE